jgi:hypothetical protein
MIPRFACLTAVFRFTRWALQKKRIPRATVGLKVQPPSESRKPVLRSA